MRKWNISSLFFLSFILLLLNNDYLLAYTKPDRTLTPGSLCESSSADFIGHFYKAEIAKCKRNVSSQKKSEVAEKYDIPRSEWNNYEFDHYIPLNAGGSNDISNIWPQPLDEAKEKNVVELKVYNGLQGGTMNQEEAVNEIENWFFPSQE
ncbi:MAG: hypothetical protein HQK51_05220 [Oligoflexia bacterium]|nr:hypothetical protein [Oligoflexia bacterium]